MNLSRPKSQGEEEAKTRRFHLLILAGGLVLTVIAATEAFTVEKLRQSNTGLLQKLADVEKLEEENVTLRGEQLRLAALEQVAADEADRLRGLIRQLQSTNNWQKATLEFCRQQNLRMEQENQELMAQAFGKPSVPRVGAWLGIGIATSENGTGVVVKSVAFKSPAALASLEEGDTIEAVDGNLVSDAETFKAIMAKKTGGQATVLDVIRDNSAVRMEVVPVDWPQ
jgi:C-terminal processing protease CtpA/Prc